ncbi:MAG TPA: ATP-binding protein [Acetobacteraceae bacterium]|nr:ATP-binding protein [Acetobacteraceae bacterium]
MRQELEQARVSLEDAQSELERMREECHGLLRAAAAQRAARARAEVAAHRAQQNTASVLTAAARAGSDPQAESEELRISLEETANLAEELRCTNEALSEANAALDSRVAERTAALDRANAKLEALNAELQQRVEAEAAARAAAQAELFKLQKLEAVGQLTGGIAHDFNNLLTVIISGLQLLGQVKDEAHRARVVRRTEEAAWRGAHLTQRLLAFARRQALSPERLDLLRHVDSIRDLLTHGLRENIQVHTDIDPALWPIEVDVAALELSLLNLAVNARDAMPQGGRLLLAARNAPLAVEPAERFSVAPGDYVEVSVADTGTGMPKELLDKVFEPFFTTKSEGKGTGLGLAQVYGFVTQSGGTAWVESAPNQGTAVRLLLPRSTRPAPERTEEAPPPPAPRQSSRLKVLVVEDDDNVAALVLDMLVQLGHSGTRVGTVASAMAVLTGAEQIDLVFSDVLLPGGGSGLDLARDMARRQIGVPMILTSGYGGGMTQRLAAANLPFLRKPYRMDSLRQAIDEALARVPAAG